jgi:hypothetical protein
MYLAEGEFSYLITTSTDDRGQGFLCNMKMHTMAHWDEYVTSHSLLIKVDVNESTPDIFTVRMRVSY